MKRLGACLLVLLLAGCGDGLNDVSGTVTWENVPVESGTIRFEPVDGVGPSAEAAVVEGAYAVRVPQGEKLVRVYSYVEVGRRYPFGKEAGPLIIHKQMIPPEFSDRSTLRVTVEGKMVYDFKK